MFGGESLGSFDQDGRLIGLESSGRLVGVPFDTSGGVAELRAATEDDLRLRDSPGDTTSAAQPVWARQPIAAVRPRSWQPAVTTEVSDATAVVGSGRRAHGVTLVAAR